MHAEANPDPMILNSMEENQWDMGMYGVMHFGGNFLRNGTSYMLNPYRTLIGNCTRQIEWYHLQVPMTTGSAQNCIWNLSNSIVYK